MTSESRVIAHRYCIRATPPEPGAQIEPIGTRARQRHTRCDVIELIGLGRPSSPRPSSRRIAGPGNRGSAARCRRPSSTPLRSSSQSSRLPGFSSRTPVRWKSLVFRVTSIRSCTIAVAAISASISGSGSGTCKVAAVTAARSSTAKTRPPNIGRTSSSSQSRSGCAPTGSLRSVRSSSKMVMTRTSVTPPKWNASLSAHPTRDSAPSDASRSPADKHPRPSAHTTPQTAARQFAGPKACLPR